MQKKKNPPLSSSKVAPGVTAAFSNGHLDKLPRLRHPHPLLHLHRCQLFSKLYLSRKHVNSCCFKTLRSQFVDRSSGRLVSLVTQEGARTWGGGHSPVDQVGLRFRHLSLMQMSPSRASFTDHFLRPLGISSLDVRELCNFPGSVSPRQKFEVTDIKALGASQLVLQCHVTDRFYLESKGKYILEM